MKPIIMNERIQEQKKMVKKLNIEFAFDKDLVGFMNSKINDNNINYNLYKDYQLFILIYL